MLNWESSRKTWRKSRNMKESKSLTDQGVHIYWALPIEGQAVDQKWAGFRNNKTENVDYSQVAYVK